MLKFCDIGGSKVWIKSEISSFLNVYFACKKHGNLFGDIILKTIKNFYKVLEWLKFISVPSSQNYFFKALTTYIVVP